MLRMSIALAAISALILNCGPYSPFASRLVVEVPVSTDVVGIYHLIGQNLNRDANFTGRNPQISISADGTCEVIDFPVWVEGPELKYSISEWLTFQGVWRLHEAGSVARGGETFTNWGIECGDSISNVGLGGELLSANEHYEILFAYGDPDSGTAMTFGK